MELKTAEGTDEQGGRLANIAFPFVCLFCFPLRAPAFFNAAERDRGSSDEEFRPSKPHRRRSYDEGRKRSKSERHDPHAHSAVDQTEGGPDLHNGQKRSLQSSSEDGGGPKGGHVVLPPYLPVNPTDQSFTPSLAERKNTTGGTTDRDRKFHEGSDKEEEELRMPLNQPVERNRCRCCSGGKVGGGCVVM